MVLVLVMGMKGLQNYLERRQSAEVGRRQPSDGYFQYINVPAPKEYEFGFNRGLFNSTALESYPNYVLYLISYYANPKHPSYITL